MAQQIDNLRGAFGKDLHAGHHQRIDDGPQVAELGIALKPLALYSYLLVIRGANSDSLKLHTSRRRPRLAPGRTQGAGRGALGSCNGPGASAGP